MTGDRTIGWIAALVWLVILAALLGTLTSERVFGPELGAWLPDLGVLLVVALASRLPERELPRLAFIAAIARVAFATDPPAAILAGYLGLIAVTFLVRSVVDVRGVGMRALVAGGGVFLMDGWLVFVSTVRLDPRVRASTIDFGDLVPTAFTSAACAFFVGAALFRLPGLTPLRKRRW